MSEIRIEDLLLTNQNEKILDQFSTKKKIPHLIFYGPPGTGKTTAAYAIAGDILMDPDSSFLELNASDERGVDVIRTTVSNFAKTSSIMDPVKILLMEECEAVTTDAQMCLRRVLEVYSSNFRVIFTTNNIHKIDPAIISRCMVLNFPLLGSCKAHEFLAKKGISPEKRVQIISSFSGDLRLLGKATEYDSSVTKSEDYETLISAFFVTKTKDSVSQIIAPLISDILSLFGSNSRLLCDKLIDVSITYFKTTEQILKFCFAVAELELAIIRGCSIKLQLYKLLDIKLTIQSDLTNTKASL